MERSNKHRATLQEAPGGATRRPWPQHAKACEAEVGRDRTRGNVARGPASEQPQLAHFSFASLGHPAQGHPSPMPPEFLRRVCGGWFSWAIKLALMVILIGSFENRVKGASSDSVTVTISPNAYYAVDIDTANVSLDLGSVNLGVSTQTVQPSTVTIQSTFATTDLRLQGAIGSAGTPWSFDADSTTVETDSLAVWATFTSTARSSAPAQTSDYFSGTVPGAAGSDMVDDTNRYAGTGGGGTNLFENNAGFDAKDMDALPPDPNANGKAHLWLFFRLPSVTTSIDSQNITLTITATAPN